MLLMSIFDPFYTVHFVSKMAMCINAFLNFEKTILYPQCPTPGARYELIFRIYFWKNGF